MSDFVNVPMVPPSSILRIHRSGGLVQPVSGQGADGRDSGDAGLRDKWWYAAVVLPRKDAGNFGVR